MQERIRPVDGDKIARDLQAQTHGRWVIWFGHHTRSFWAITRGDHWSGHIEARTPRELIARLAEVDAWFGFGRPSIRTRSGAWALT